MNIGAATGTDLCQPGVKKYVPPPPTTRIYYLGVPASPTRSPIGTTRRIARIHTIFRDAALLASINTWITHGTAPPESLIPRINKDQLVTPGALNFPKVPGVNAPQQPSDAWRTDFGPDFRSKGVESIEPPNVGKPFPTLAPQVDRDGNETAGLRLPEPAVPLATFRPGTCVTRKSERRTRFRAWSGRYYLCANQS